MIRFLLAVLCVKIKTRKRTLLIIQNGTLITQHYTVAHPLVCNILFNVFSEKLLASGLILQLPTAQASQNVANQRMRESVILSILADQDLTPLCTGNELTSWRFC